MAHIKTVRVRNADTAVRKGFVHAFHGLITSLRAQTRSGDCFEVEMDDGTVQTYRFADGDQGHRKMHNDEGLELHLVPGKEP